MEPHKLVGVLGQWSKGAGPLYRLLAAALRDAILRGDIATGARLPAERQLAQLLAISRTTVIAAYDRLRQEGWIERRTGSGTWVRPPVGKQAVERQDAVAGELARSPLYDKLLGRAQVIIDFSEPNTGDPQSLPPGSFVLDEAELAQLFQEPGYAPLGLPALRQALADHYTQTGLPTTPEQILVTSGAQQAITLAAGLYVQRGDSVLIENPTYSGALDTLRAAGGRLIPVPVEEWGLRVDLLRGLVETHRPQLLYVTPTCHNPTGTVLAAKGRREIGQIAGEHNLPVLEDTTLADLVLAGAEPPSIAAYAPEATIISIGSTSKLFWAGLRVGWVRAPQAVVARLARLKLVADLGTSLIPQALAARLIPRTEELKTLRRRQLRPRLALLSALLQEHLPAWTWVPPAGGTSLWVRLPDVDSRAFAQLALRYGTLVIPGPTLAVDGTHAEYLRLPFFLDPAILREGSSRLAEAWATFTRRAGAEHSIIPVVV